MPADAPCPNPDCPMLFRRHEDTGIQAVLSAIEGVNARLGSIDNHLMAVTTQVAGHEKEIETIKDNAKGSVDRRWMIAAASIGLLPAIFGWFVKLVRGN